MASLTAAMNPELVLSMEAMERTTPAHYDEWNTRHQQFLDNDKFLAEQFKRTIVDNAGSHNSIYRGKDLTNVYTVDEICERISDGTFRDLYIGDYFDKSITTSLGGTETVRLVLAGFDVLIGNGSLKHHAVVIPKNAFNKRASMNDVNTASGGYANSKLHTETLMIYTEALQSVLNNRIIAHEEILSKEISRADTDISNVGEGHIGRSSSNVSKLCELMLMSEIQVYGCTVCSSSFRDIGTANIQFPLFRLAPELKVVNLGNNEKVRTGYWLSAVAHEGAFACCDDNGFSTFHNAGGSNGVRPYFCIG